MKRDSFLKIIIISIVGIAVLWLAKAYLFPSNYISLTYGGDHMYMNGNYSIGYGTGLGTLSVLFVFLIKVLIVIFVIALIVGLVMALKNYIFTPQDIAAFKGGFTRAEEPKKTCDICGKTLEEGWKVCPYCSAEIKK